MSIKSDKWIRRMAIAHRMIEPFEAGQVREAKGQKIVSYGTSSYGYDVRCSNEFKIFTNINSTIVDPKRFDAGSFVDLGDICIVRRFIPAADDRYFRIPPTCWCVLRRVGVEGVPAPRVALVDGIADAEDMTSVRTPARLWGYSIGEGGRHRVFSAAPYRSSYCWIRTRWR
jgi:deoxycytidine triphosphate deaminase